MGKGRSKTAVWYQPALQLPSFQRQREPEQLLLRLEEENAAQYTDQRSLIQDSEKERELLKEELEEVLSGKEALQHNLQELKNASEKTRTENEDLLS